MPHVSNGYAVTNMFYLVIAQLL